MKDIYLKFEGGTELQGDSTDQKHVNEIEIKRYAHKITQPKSSTVSSAGGHTAERTEHGEMLFTKEIDKSSSKLLRACSAGTVYPKATITFYRSFGGKGTTETSQSRVDYFKVTLENVVVSSVDMEIASEELPSEVFGLRYSKVVWEYKQQKSDGSSASTGPAGWDLRQNVAV